MLSVRGDSAHQVANLSFTRMPVSVTRKECVAWLGDVQLLLLKTWGLANGHACSCWPPFWLSERPQGGRPVSISTTVQPTAHMSAARPWPTPLMTSGAM